MPEKFPVTKKDGTTVDVMIWTPEELRAACRSNDQPIKAEVNKALKAFGVPPPNLLHIKPEEKEAAILKGYEDYGVSTNGAPPKAKANPAATAEPATTSAAAPANNGLAARASKAAATAAGVTEASGDVVALIKALRAELKAMSQKIDTLTEAEERRQAEELLRDKAIVAVHELAVETFQFVAETHFLVRATGPLGAGLLEEDVILCADDLHGKFLVDPTEIEATELAASLPAEEGEEGEEGNE